jgi:nitrite reductase/ring-hydroxylating ferredoxin subunit
VASIKVAKAADVPPGQGSVVQAGATTLALFNVDGTYYAVDNTCPHRGGPLGDGDLEGRFAICPWHGWRWDVTSGANANNPAVKIACFATTVVDGWVHVEMP